jgi:hypothetical protein
MEWCYNSKYQLINSGLKRFTDEKKIGATVVPKATAF